VVDPHPKPSPELEDREMNREVPPTSEPRSLSIDVVERGEVATVTIAGEIDLDTSDEVGRALTGSSAANCVDVDLAGVSYIDSTGLRSLLTAKTELEKQGRRLRVTHASSIVNRLCEILGVAALLDGSS
jgi:anti-sigma B factor antagonist